MSDLLPWQQANEALNSPTGRAIAKMIQPNPHAAMLGDLLAVVFRDGGHMQRAVGDELACSKAKHDVTEMHAALEESNIAYINLHNEVAAALKIAETGRITEALESLNAALNTRHA